MLIVSYRSMIMVPLNLLFIQIFLIVCCWFFDRQLQSLQSFYSTVNSQLVVAEQLAECLSQQMEALNISFTPDKLGKSRNMKDLLFKSIGLSPGESCFPSDMKEKVASPPLLQKFTYSPSLSTSKESPIQKQTRAYMLQEPDSVRRRRDPIDNVIL
jgi:hypothetical protein